MIYHRNFNIKKNLPIILIFIYGILLANCNNYFKQKSLMNKKSSWTCNDCTFINNLKYDVCKICYSERKLENNKINIGCDKNILENLILLGYGYKLSLETAKKYNDINKAIDYLENNKKNDNSVNYISSNKNNKIKNLVINDEKIDDNIEIIKAISYIKLPANYKNIIIFFPGMVRQGKDDSYKMRSNFPGSFFISDNEINYECGIKNTINNRIKAFKNIFLNYKCIIDYNKNLFINVISYSQGAILGIRTISYFKLENINSFHSLASPWLGTVLANRSRSYDPNAGSALDKTISFFRQFRVVSAETTAYACLALFTNRNDFTSFDGLWELGSENIEFIKENKRLLKKFKQKGCRIYFLIASNDIFVNPNSSSCGYFDKKNTKIINTTHSAIIENYETFNYIKNNL